jgi:hypothetical protein
MKKAGFDFNQTPASLTRAEYERLASEARKAGIPLTGGVPIDVGLERVLRARQASIENLEGYLPSLEGDDSPMRYADPLTRANHLQDYYDEKKIPRLAADLRASGVANTPTLFVNHAALTQQPPESLARWPEMRYVTAPLLAAWTRQLRRAQEQTGDFNRGPRFLEYRNRVTKGLSDGGALLLVGSDAPNAFLVPGFATLYEIHSLTVAGLSRYQALRAATRNAAEFVHRETEVGTVAPGQRADLILLKANPLESVGNLTLRVGVMLRGRWLPAEALDTMLEKVAADVRPRP